MSRIFYDLQKPTLKQVRSILVWGNKNALKTQIDSLNCRVSCCRQRSDKSFEEVMGYLDKTAAGYFRMVLENSEYPIIDEFRGKTILELFVRSIDVGDVEYFIFIYLAPTKLDYLIKNYKISELT